MAVISHRGLILIVLISLGSPKIHAINPPYGSSSGGDAIEITGANFFSDAQANCVFNGSIATAASFKSSSLVLCLTPATVIDSAADPAEVSVAVVFEGTQYEAPEKFSIYGKFLIYDIPSYQRSLTELPHFSLSSTHCLGCKTRFYYGKR